MPVLVSYIQRTVGDGWSFIILRIRGGIPCFEEVMPIRGGHQPESSSLAHGHDPDGTSADTGLIKGIIVSILVGHAQQTMDAASDGGGEQRWRGAKIAITYLLSWWNLPGIHKCQVGGVELDDGNGIGLWL